MAVTAMTELFPNGQNSYLRPTLQRTNVGDAPRQPFVNPEVIMSISHLANEVRHSWERYRTYRDAVRQLSALDDRQLADIGVDRGRIQDLVRLGR
jgi:uncharacterized protein YjiS (DUF1127 family)